MRRKSLIVGALVAALSIGATGAVLAGFAGPGPWITGNDTGGIIPYSPDLEGSYAQIAQDYCARWHRLSNVTSVHRVYGDYISFVCIDKPGHDFQLQSAVARSRANRRSDRLDELSSAAHRGRIGAQDARAKRNPHHVRQFE